MIRHVLNEDMFIKKFKSVYPFTNGIPVYRTISKLLIFPNKLGLF